MKRLILKLLSLSFLFISPAFAISEGNEYIKLADPIPNAENSVIEVWSYRCSHCWDHHKFGTMDKISAALPDARMGYLMVKTMGDYGVQASEVLAFAQDVDEKAGVKLASKSSAYHKVSDAYFDAYFKKKQRWGNGAEPEKFYAVGLKALGVSKADLDAFLQTDRAKQIIKESDAADAISKYFGTPGFVVNGKYEVNVSKVPSPEALIQIIKELIKL